MLVLMLVLPVYIYRWMRAKRLARIETQLPDALTMVPGALRAGASLSIALDNLVGEQRRNERFQRAEKLAMEAPIKLVGPLIIFIFPVTFIVLAFPIVMKFMSQGGM